MVVGVFFAPQHVVLTTNTPKYRFGQFWLNVRLLSRRESQCSFCCVFLNFRDGVFGWDGLVLARQHVSQNFVH